MVNLHMSAMFACKRLSCDKKVKMYVVTQQNTKGIPMCVHQYGNRSKSKLDEQGNTMKVAILKGDHLIKELVAISYYNTKPI